MAEDPRQAVGEGRWIEGIVDVEDEVLANDGMGLDVVLAIAVLVPGVDVCAEDVITTELDGLYDDEIAIELAGGATAGGPEVNL